jgi:hypothetical protein
MSQDHPAGRITRKASGLSASLPGLPSGHFLQKRMATAQEMGICGASHNECSFFKLCLRA